MRPMLMLSVLLALGVARADEPKKRTPVRARLSAEAADEIAERTAGAPLVIVGRTLRVTRDDQADCQVWSVLKGQYENKTFRVRFSRIYGGAWPQAGVAAVYFLRPLGGSAKRPWTARTILELCSDTKGMASPTLDVRAVIKLTAQGKYIRSSERQRVMLKLPAADSVEGTVLDSSFVTLGTVEEVRLSQDPAIAAKLTYRIEQVLKGRVRPGKVIVNVPAVAAEVADPGRKRLTPRVGPAVLMFVRRSRGGPFETVSPYRGYIAVAGRARLGEWRREMRAAVAGELRLRKQGLVGNPAGKESVAATLLTWQRAWNAKEIEPVISCYSQRNKWSKKWASGIKGKRELTRILHDYPARIRAVLSRVKVVDKKRGLAMASVRLRVVTNDNIDEVRPVVMTFVFENGMWLILEEGS